MAKLEPTPDRTPEILIVEDSPTQAEHLKYILEQKHYRFATARNGREALAAVAAHMPALVISDIVMPEMDGYEMCRRLKAEEAFKHIPVILLTSLSDPVDVVKGLECGADNFIFKPYDALYLLSRIALVLANRERREREEVRTPQEVFFAGRKFFITADRAQILNLLLSTYETAVERNRELAAARDDLRRLNGSLEEMVRQRTAALEAEVVERARAEGEVRRLNAELEQRVRDRTAELEATNRELEAFSYSVSHDLRAPLRHVHGFLELLHKKIGASLDEEGQRLFRTIGRSAEKMGKLIDELLEFSRMGRMEMRQGAVDLNGLVREVLHDFEPETKGRKIEWDIPTLPAVQADRAMLHQVFANLIGNAIKYSRTRETAKIGVGFEEKSDEWVFHVRDNGVGFDMQYADELFGVFKRLHHASEFEGVGIGLANVRRIVGRHSGRTWADAKEGVGATFFFSLPKRTVAAPKAKDDKNFTGGR